MKPIIYYRENITNIFNPDEEWNIAGKYFDTTNSRMDCANRLVIGRYSVRPFYKELERDLSKVNSNLINSFSQHHFISNFNWYEHVKEFTPKTYFSLLETPKDENRDFVVKGRTNSRKQEWLTKMFAHGYTRAAEIFSDLSVDPLIHDQGIIIRDFVPLKVLGESIKGLPYTNEHRFFFYGRNEITNFYYWCCNDQVGILNQEGKDFAQKIANILVEHVNFFVLDIAEKKDGGWILIEVNDGQMSGLDSSYTDELYRNLSKHF